MRRVAITGATGMIGAALAELCAAKGIGVLALANPGSVRAANLAALGKSIQVELCALDGYAALAANRAANLPRCDAFFHFAWAGTTGAARSDASLQARNAEHACDAVHLAASLGCSRFIFAGSQAEYGPLEGPYGPDTPTNPVNEYGRGKLAAGKATRTLCDELGLEHVWVRIGSVYGPRDHTRSVIMLALAAAAEGGEFPCTAGEQLWDHLHVHDAARALLLMAERGLPGSIYPLGSGTAEPLRNHIEVACSALEPGATPVFGAIPYPPGQQMYLCADISALARDTGFAPEYGFAAGITQTAEWYRMQLRN